MDGVSALGLTASRRTKESWKKRACLRPTCLQRQTARTDLDASGITSWTARFVLISPVVRENQSVYKFESICVAASQLPLSSVT